MSGKCHMVALAVSSVGPLPYGRGSFGSIALRSVNGNEPAVRSKSRREEGLEVMTSRVLSLSADVGAELTLSDLWRNAGLPLSASASACTLRIMGVTDDSRAVQPGCLFVAVRGAKSDGHDFANAAAKAGAAAIIAERDVVAPVGVLVLRVADSREALARLGGAFYGLRGSNAGRFPVIGVTGTNGKTSVTWLLRSILQHAGHHVTMLGTIEYDLVTERRSASLTTPGALELCRMVAQARQSGAEYAVMETSSHALDQRRCDGLHFAAGVFTNLTGEHLDYHHTMSAYLQAKRRLFTMLDADGVAVVNADDPSSDRVIEGTRARLVRYGLYTSHLDVQGVPISSDRRGQRFELRIRGEGTPIQLSLVGRHNVLNALAAAATADALGIDRAAIFAGIERLTRVPGRLQRIEPEGFPFSVYVDYAHTDDALENVLHAMQPLANGRVICVFGCGGDRDREKRPRMAAVAGRLADVTFVTSDNPRSENPDEIIDEIMAGFGDRTKSEVRRQVDRRLAIQEALVEAKRGDVVLIAGKGHENYQLIGGKSMPFDDAEVARLLLFAPATAEEVA